MGIASGMTEAYAEGCTSKAVSWYGVGNVAVPR